MITLPRNPLKPGERPDPATRSRRRFARRQWLRRWLVWRYVIASFLLVALVVGVIWLVFISSLLTVQQVKVEGESQLSEQQILAAARVPDGAHLAQLDLGAIRSRVGALAPVRRVDVSRNWPHGVLIKVTERTPVAVVEIGGSFHAMDADGVIFRDYAASPGGHAARRVDRRHGQRRARRGRPRHRVPALRPGRAGRPRRRGRRRPGLAGDARRRRGGLGERRAVRPQGPGAGAPARPSPVTPTTSAFRASRSPAPAELGPPAHRPAENAEEIADTPDVPANCSAFSARVRVSAHPARK